MAATDTTQRMVDVPRQFVNQPNINVNVTVQAPPPIIMPSPPAVAQVVVMNQHSTGPGLLVRGLYFVFIGLWLGMVWTSVAWLLLISIIGLPLGLMMLHRIPQVMTLRPIASKTKVTVHGNVVVVAQDRLQQQQFWVRAVYFILVGWWLSGMWLSLAWSVIAVTFGLGLPLAFWMFDRTPAIVSLARQ